MGNQIALAREPPELKNLFRTEDQENTENKKDDKNKNMKGGTRQNIIEKYQNYLLLWKFQPDEVEETQIDVTGVKFSEIQEFAPKNAYIILHTYCSTQPSNKEAEQQEMEPEEEQVENLQEEEEEEEEEEELLEKWLSSSEDNMSPRGLGCWFELIGEGGGLGTSIGEGIRIELGKKKKIARIWFTVYLWSGKNSSGLTKALGLSHAFELVRNLKSQWAHFLSIKERFTLLSSVMGKSFSPLEDPSSLARQKKNRLLFILYNNSKLNSKSTTFETEIELRHKVKLNFYLPPNISSVRTLLRSVPPNHFNKSNSDSSVARKSNFDEAGTQKKSPLSASSKVNKLALGSLSGGSSEEKKDGKGITLSVSSVATVNNSSNNLSNSSKKQMIRNLSLNIKDAKEEPKASEATGSPSTTIGEKPKLGLPLAISNNKPAGLKFSLKVDNIDSNDVPVDELQGKRERLLKFIGVCSKIEDDLFLGSEVVAKNKEVLGGEGITHIVNCAGVVCPESFPDDFKYLTLWLRDAKGENITSILYDVLEYIDQAIINGGKVFVHCQQGVSRSSSMVIGYLMYKKGWGFTETHSYVKKIRGVSNPNTGFTYQLLEWYKKLHTPITKSRLYRIAPQSSDAPDFLVPKKQEDLVWSSLDCRGTFVLHSPDCLYVWVGSQTTEPFVQAAHRYVKHLQKFEKATENVQVIKQSQENPDFFKELGVKVGDDGKPIGYDVGQCSRYDQDFELAALPPNPRKPGFMAAQFNLDTSAEDENSNNNTESNTNLNKKKGNDDDDDESEDADEEPLTKKELKASLYQYKRSEENWEEIPLFDSDDLNSNFLFIVVSNMKEVKPKLFVWMGSVYKKSLEKEKDKEKEKKKSKEKDSKGKEKSKERIHGEKVANSFCKKFNIEKPQIHVIYQEKEPDSFWDYFVNG